MEYIMAINNSKALAPEMQAQQEQSININDLMAEIKALREHQAQLEAFASNTLARAQAAENMVAIMRAEKEEEEDSEYAKFEKKMWFTKPFTLGGEGMNVLFQGARFGTRNTGKVLKVADKNINTSIENLDNSWSSWNQSVALENFKEACLETGQSLTYAQYKDKDLLFALKLEKAQKDIAEILAKQAKKNK